MGQLTIDDIEYSYRNIILRFGKVSGVDTDWTPIWDGGPGEYTGFLTTESLVDVVSDSAEDDTGGGGATKIKLVGQGNNGLEITEEILLSGVTPVTSTKKFKIIYHVEIVLSEDSSPVTGPNHGTISIYKIAAAATVMALILPMYGVSLMAIYRIPSDKYGEIRRCAIYASSGKNAELKMMVRRNMDSAWVTRATYNAYQASVGIRRYNPSFVGPGWDIVCMTKSSAAGTDVDSNYGIELKDIPQGIS